MRHRISVIALIVGFQAALLLPAAVVHAQAAGRGACFTEAGCEQKEVDGDFVSSEEDPEIAKICEAGRGFCYAKPKPVDLIISIGGIGQVEDLGAYIAAVYRYAVSIAGVIAAVIMMIGGFQYLTAGGDASRVTQGKERIVNALVGLFLTLSAYLILNTINPDLVKLQLPRIPIVKRQEFVQCRFTELQAKCGQLYGVRKKAGAPENSSNPIYFETVDDPKADGVIAECTGMSCGKVPGLNDSTYNCVDPSKSKSSGTVAPDREDGPVKPFVCKTCKGYGDSCSSPGASDECCTGFCGGNRLTEGGTCSSGQPGDKCQSASECKTGLCQTRLSNSCSAGLVGSPCSNDRECREGNVCVETVGWYICVPPKVGGFCDKDADCPGNSKCGTAWVQLGQIGYCTLPGTSTLDRCALDSQCPGGKCLSSIILCSDMEVGSPCTSGSDCKSNICIGHAGALAKGVCGDGKVGSRCDDNSDCINPETGARPGYCFTVALGGTDFGTCTAGQPGDACGARDDCATNKCDAKNWRCLP